MEEELLETENDSLLTNETASNEILTNGTASNEMLTNGTAGNETSVDGSQPINDEKMVTNEKATNETVTNEKATATNKSGYKSNLYDDKVQEEQEEYVSFESENSPFKDSPFKETFKNSKITVKDFSKFENQINYLASSEAFYKNLNEAYGEQAEEVLANYQNLTSDIFTKEERDKLNRLPANYKSLMVKMGLALGGKIDKIRSDYGLTSQETKALPEISKSDAEQRFSQLTQQMLKGGLSSEDYTRIKNERLELVKYMN